MTWIAPWNCEPWTSWVYHEWRIAEPITKRTYELETGYRWFGFEFVRVETKKGMVL